ncbi:MAG: hypothetical protein DHS20C17_32620 [Cyclobacteriaceae bacterium]|nr:MAG: hypothetical protein DHS20C17_32620 [Cyclobacteriaceae bacterium]
MKRNYAFLLGIFATLSFYAQAQMWPIETVADNIIGAWTRAADFDQDGDPDMLVQSGDTIFWYENLRPGWMPHIIDTTFYDSELGYVDVLDVDLDGDMDVLKVSLPGEGGDPLTWNENRSQGSEWIKHDIITTIGIVGWLENSYGDLDGDGDTDLVISEFDISNPPEIGLYWLENVDTSGVWIKHPLKPGNNWYSCVADMDGDGDQDVIGSWEGVFWLENQLPDTSWTIHPIVSDGMFSHFLGTCADMNGDSIPDVISVAPGEGNSEIVYYSNPDWQVTEIKPFETPLYIGAIGDLDDDGDMDVPYGGVGGFSQALGWVENQSDGTMWIQHDITENTMLQMIPTGIADIDGDGDQDIISLTFGETGFGSAIWLANPQIITDVENPGFVSGKPKLDLWPNPSSTEVHIEYELPEGEMVHISVKDLYGHEIYKLVNVRQEAGTHRLSWDGSMANGMQAPAGAYAVQMSIGKAVLSKKAVWLPR